MLFIRFEATAPNHRGQRPGVFALANGLARSGRLDAVEWIWWRANNDWFDAAYPDPGLRNASLFDTSVHPAVSCWFKETARHLLSRVPGYLELLDRHGIGWVRRVSSVPGHVLYEDDVQIVVAPVPPVSVCGGLATLQDPQRAL